MGRRHDHLPYTPLEAERYLAALKALALTLGRSPRHGDYLRACDPRGAKRRPAEVLCRVFRVSSWAGVLAAAGLAPIPQAPREKPSQRETRLAARRRRDASFPAARMYSSCLNRPECTGVPDQPGRRYCAACDPTVQSEGIADGFGLRGVRVR